MFAAAPPLAAKKVLFSLLASMPEMCLDSTDVVEAYYHARARRSVCMGLPREDHQEEM